MKKLAKQHLLPAGGKAKKPPKPKKDWGKAFQNFAAKVRGAGPAAKAKWQGLHPSKKGALIGGTVLGLYGAARQARHNRDVDLQGTFEEREFKNRHKILTHPATAGVTFGAAGAFAGHRVGKGIHAAKSAYHQATGIPPVPSWLKGVKTKAEAKKAYRAKAKQYHPDTGGDQEMMKKINTEWADFDKHHLDKLAQYMRPFFAELRYIRETS